MNYTHAQILDLTGMTQDRLRHWRKEIHGLDTRAARRGVITFEEVALLAALSQATDELGLAVSLIAAHYEDILAMLQENEFVGELDIVLWLGVDGATITPIGSPPDLAVAAMIRLAPIMQRLDEKIHRPSSRQLALALHTDRGR